MEKAAIAVSGGIDSLVAAFLLKKKYDVTGIHFFTGYESKNKSKIKQQLAKMCEDLEIPVVFLDIQEAFNEKVISYFKESYLKGLTPNPCLVCNPLIKFSLLLDEAESLGINKIATGHYVKTELDQDGNIYILKGRDPLKDQSYFLSMVKSENLKKALFPLGNLKKTQVKKIAENFGLKPVDKDESQDICFVKNKDYSSFITATTSIKFSTGPIINKEGKKIGSHNGVHKFTIGQRKGLNCPGPYPYYVLEINPSQNTIIVGPKEALLSNSLIIEKTNWFKKPAAFPFTAYVKIRYAHKPQKADISELNNNTYLINFHDPVSSVTPGQGAAIYIDEKIVGAGFIVKENEKI